MPTDQEYRDRATAMANMLASHPERHSQGTFGRVRTENECGTVACVAGWGALAERGIVTIALDGEMTWPETALHELRVCDCPPSSGCRRAVPGQRTLLPMSHMDDVVERGAEWLGITDHTSMHELFYNTNEEQAIAVLRAIGAGQLRRNDITAGAVDEVTYA